MNLTHSGGVAEDGCRKLSVSSFCFDLVGYLSRGRNAPLKVWVAPNDHLRCVWDGGAELSDATCKLSDH